MTLGGAVGLALLWMGMGCDGPPAPDPAAQCEGTAAGKADDAAGAGDDRRPPLVSLGISGLYLAHQLPRQDVLAHLPDWLRLGPEHGETDTATVLQLLAHSEDVRLLGAEDPVVDELRYAESLFLIPNVYLTEGSCDGVQGPFRYIVQLYTDESLSARVIRAASELLTPNANLAGVDVSNTSAEGCALPPEGDDPRQVPWARYAVDSGDRPTLAYSAEICEDPDFDPGSAPGAGQFVPWLWSVASQPTIEERFLGARSVVAFDYGDLAQARVRPTQARYTLRGFGEVRAGEVDRFATEPSPTGAALLATDLAIAAPRICF